MKDHSTCCNVTSTATCASILSPKTFCNIKATDLRGKVICESFENNNMHSWNCKQITSCGSYGRICGGFAQTVSILTYIYIVILF